MLHDETVVGEVECTLECREGGVVDEAGELGLGAALRRRVGIETVGGRIDVRGECVEGC